MKLDSVHIGVDVSKAKLDIYVPARKDGERPTSEEVENNIEGFRRLRNLARKARATVCVEPTGGYELELVDFLLESKVPVAYADALRVREFARAAGIPSKNDTIDAALISRFADTMGVRELGEKDIATAELRRRVKFRQTMVEMRTALQGRLDTESDKEMQSMLKAQIRHFDKVIRKIEEKCLEVVAKDKEKNSLRERFTQVGGVGDRTAIAIMAGLPEIGTLSDEKLNRLVGISPEEKQSGTKECKRKIWGGRKDVRDALYMACIAALTWNSRLGDYYRRRRAEGHPHKWVMVPVMRKMLSLLNHIARDPDYVPEKEPESTKKNAHVGRKAKALA